MKRTCWKPQKRVHYAQKVEEQESEQKEEKEENPEQRNSHSGRTNLAKGPNKNFRN